MINAAPQCGDSAASNPRRAGKIPSRYRVIHRAVRCALAMASFPAVLGESSTPVDAAWDPINGIKTESDTVFESNPNYFGPQLLAAGGALNFGGSAASNGSITLQQQNGWGNPLV